MRNLFAWKIATLIAISIWLWSTFVAIQPAPDWRDGELYVATPPNGLDVDAAFELELATLFAQRLQLKIKPIAMDYDQLDGALTSHAVHLAAAGIRSSVSSTLRFSPSYQTLKEQVVCKDETPHRLGELAKFTLAVVAESAQENALRDTVRRVPNLSWEVSHDQSSSSLLQEVAEGELDCTVANEEQIALARNFYPQLGDAVDLVSSSHLAWAFAADVDKKLFNAAKEFFTSIQKDGTLAHLIDRHYGHNERLESIDVSTFNERAQTVLPQFEPMFKEAETLTGLDWKLLAALAYQESHWDPLATSYTNVRGMMMLTEDTAARMGVTNRLDAQASIMAGAKYLKLMKNALPKRINDKDRSWLAMAAYNQGLGHLEDARVLTVKTGLNPDIWSDVKKVMPLLSRPAYYEEAKHGQARGGEAVILVETVRLYHEMLMQMETRSPLHQLPPSLRLSLGSYTDKQ
ncbi:MAG: membrane-bound lytic murein transglycosylase MltF [Gallionellaceae bacterium]|nr:membrane-bound lytic murein transglycosylase MltF [Gallionellaceae bacterium]